MVFCISFALIWALSLGTQIAITASKTPRIATSNQEQVKTIQHLGNLSLYFWLFPDVQYRSSCPEVFLGKDVLKICRKFMGKHPWCSPVNVLHIFRTSFPKSTSEGLFLPIKMVKTVAVFSSSFTSNVSIV